MESIKNYFKLLKILLFLSLIFVAFLIVQYKTEFTEELSSVKTKIDKVKYIKLSKEDLKQKRRLRQVKQVCDSYKSDEVFKQMYVDKPGSRIRGKFTFERRSKLVFCNIMKQGLLR